MHACDIVAEALEIADSVPRMTFVEKTCGSDASLRERVLAMLEFHDANHAFLSETSFDHGLVGERLGEALGSVIGKYKLLEEIGEGGFGTVYLAEQTTPVSRKVALKVIKLGMDTRQVVARFEAERQALAMMDHPNIARVLDAGATESGRPYFAMELVNGISITEFCDQNRMDITLRLELFLEVCQAVQHAHQKGIIHRDLKPSNILVTLKGDKPVPKVIDFGVAKAIDQRLTEHTLFTHFGQMVGTPQYMSPEQAQMSVLDVDTRSDVYTLGVLLFELLTGEPPVSAARLRTAGFDEMRRIIAEEEAPTPSSKISTWNEQSARIADCRTMETRKLGQLFRGDLDWIVIKTLSKDPDQRYSSASALAADVQRHLQDEPVLAGPPSSVYRLRKFTKRNRALVLGTAATMAGFLVGLAFTVVALIQTNQALNAVTEAKSEAETISSLLKDLIARSDPSLGKGPDYRVSEMLDDFARDLPDLTGQPKVELDLRLTLGRAYEQLALSDKTTVHLLRAISLQKQLYGDADLRVADTLSDLAWITFDAGKFPRNTNLARQYAQEAIDICRRQNDASERTVLAHGAMAFALLQLGKTSEAEQVLQEALEVLRRSGEVVDESRIPMVFARIRLEQGRPAEALALIQSAIDARIREGAEPSSGQRLLLASCFRDLGELERSDQELLVLLANVPRAFGSYTYDEKRVFQARADLMRLRGRYTEAAEWLDKGRDGVTKTVLFSLLPDWAMAQLDLGHMVEVEEYCQQIAAELSDTDEELNTKVVAHTIREFTLEIIDPGSVKDVASANRSDFRRANEIWQDDHGLHLMLAWNLLRAAPDDADALQQATTAAELSVAELGEADREARKDFRGTLPYHVLARVKAAAADYEAAIDLQQQALEILPPNHWFLRGCFETSLAKYYVAAELRDEAHRVLEEAVSHLEQADLPPELHFHRARGQLDLAEFLVEHGQPDDIGEAERLTLTATGLLQRSKEPTISTENAPKDFSRKAKPDKRPKAF